MTKELALMTKSRRVYYKGSVSSRNEVGKYLLDPGDFVIIERGVPRYMVLLCPCGCGDELVINLDKRAGPAWRLYQNFGCYTLYPSYWKDSGCGSHFIIWNNRIHWFDNSYEWDDEWGVTEEIEKAVLCVLKNEEYIHYLQLADESGILPWECLQACRQLVEKRQCVPNDGDNQVYFKKAN
jgi:hypothetical protein